MQAPATATTGTKVVPQDQSPRRIAPCLTTSTKTLRAIGASTASSCSPALTATSLSTGSTRTLTEVGLVLAREIRDGPGRRHDGFRPPPQLRHGLCYLPLLQAAPRLGLAFLRLLRVARDERHQRRQPVAIVGFLIGGMQTAQI